MLTEEEVEQILYNKGATIADNALWPDKKIPFKFDPEDKFTPEEEKIILEGIELINSNLKGCLQIVPFEEGVQNYLDFCKHKDTCASFYGMRGGGQVVSMASDCLVTGTVAHELLHAAGFFHEQRRPDRDDYVTFHRENLKDPENDKQYRKYAVEDVDLYNLPYDYDSIMHYPESSVDAKQVDGYSLVILEPKQPGVKIGQRDHLSKTDIAMVRARYGCDK